MSRKTKLICTLGPATESEETIALLMDAGTNVFRLNMSHAKHEWAAKMVKQVRKLASRRGEYIGILFDLTGPSIRTGELPEPYQLVEGDTVEFRKAGTEPETPSPPPSTTTDSWPMSPWATRSSWTMACC